MRTIGHLPHAQLKITLMHHGRYLLKLEDQDVEIVYRFRDGEGVHDLASAAELLAAGLLTDAESSLAQLSASRLRSVRPTIKPDESFPTIV